MQKHLDEHKYVQMLRLRYIMPHILIKQQDK